MTQYEPDINEAVKAIIYRNDGRILMQQRDDFSSLPFKNCWTFFGGLIEKGESIVNALERELSEELGGVPGKIEPELFQWDWNSDWNSTRNNFIPIQINVDEYSLKLKEGQAMGWFYLHELVSISLTPAVYENISRIAKFLVKYCPDIEDDLENKILEHGGLIKKNDRVYYAKKNPFGLSRQLIFFIKELALLRSIKLCRVCMHVDDECDIHEMLMIHTQANLVGPLRQNKTSISYHIMEGELDIKLFNESGIELDEFTLNQDKSSCQYLKSLRLNANQYRSIQSKTDFSIFLETASGPFKDSDTDWLNT